LMQSVGPARVARLARAMGVNESPLEAVPALALGTSPVTLKEMVSAYSSIAHDGQYLAPMLVTRIENRQGEVLAEFAPAEPQRALSAQANYALLDAMRGVIDRGTGVAIRSRYGFRADVAGKTGTTQNNTDGWFILLHPQLVAGAWVGFNDGRITLRSDYWGQGARSALPIVGEVTAQALRARLIDPRALFEAPPEGFFSQLGKGLQDWVQGLLSREPAPEPEAAPEPVLQGAPVPEEVVEEPAVPASEPVESGGPQLTLPASAPVSAISEVPAVAPASALEPLAPAVPLPVTDPASAAVPAEGPR